MRIYTIYLNVNGGNPLDKTTFTIAYGETYTLPQPTHDDVGNDQYKFHSWRYSSVKGSKINTSGVWTYDYASEEITLYAKWDDGYTGNY